MKLLKQKEKDLQEQQCVFLCVLPSDGDFSEYSQFDDAGDFGTGVVKLVRAEKSTTNSHTHMTKNKQTNKQNP